MKRLIVIMILLWSSVSYAETPQYLFQNASSIADSVNLSTGIGMETKDSTVVCTFTGAVTALVVDVMSTISDFDGSEYDTRATHTFSAGEITNARATFALVDLFGTGWKANLTTLTKTGTVAVSCKMARYRPGYM